ncbi:MAG TPA: NADH-quinone oxidoreductase subunit J [Gaiellales bacterium]|nr:NADH-quinone oxidoreductase subunit J [Gaiellales bacterium]
MTYEIVFVAAGVLAIGSALGVVLSSNPFHSALSLILNLAALATFYLLLSADFLAAAQVIVYAGAVMIMFLFVTAYLGGHAAEPVVDRPLWQTAAALVAAGAVVAELVFALASAGYHRAPAVAAGFGSAQDVGAGFLSRYLLAFEATSILLLVAAVGGVVLGTRRPAPRAVGEEGAFERPWQPVPPSVQSDVMDVETRFTVTPLEGAPEPEVKA